MGQATSHSQAPPPRAQSERSVGVERLLMQFRPGLAQRMTPRELRAEVLVAATLLLAALPLAILAPGRGTHRPLVLLLFIVLYGLTSTIEFDVGSGYGYPTELVLVPMLFALPAGWVPLLVAGGFVVGRLPSYARGGRHPDRIVAALGNSWHAIGPALIFVAAGIHGPSWSQWPLLVAALASQLVGDFAATVAREWLRLGELPRLSVKLLGPVYLTDVCLAPVAVAVAFAAQGHPAATAVALPLAGLLMFFARDRRARMAAALELSRAYRGTALLLGDMVEADDAYTGSHSRDVVELSIAVGPRLGLDDDGLRRLEFAALLHDVGKIAISNEIINKAGPLTDQERAVIETHTVEGEAMLDGVGGLLGEVGRIVRSCHERYDGLGYPDGLVGDAIPLEARIVTCCDAFNAMTTNRPYRKAIPLPEALNELVVHRGTQFDPDVVDALLALHVDHLHAVGAVIPAEPEPEPQPTVHFPPRDPHAHAVAGRLRAGRS